MQLREIVGRYLALAGSYGKPAPLSGFGLGQQETERLFALLDEDYHISRFFQFHDQSGPRYEINGFGHTHVSIAADIQSIL